MKEAKQNKTIHHLIRRENKPGSGKTFNGVPLIPAKNLPEGHSPAKLLASYRRGKIEGSGPVFREPTDRMMVELVGLGEMYSMPEGDK